MRADAKHTTEVAKQGGGPAFLSNTDRNPNEKHNTLTQPFWGRFLDVFEPRVECGARAPTTLEQRVTQVLNVLTTFLLNCAWNAPHPSTFFEIFQTTFPERFSNALPFRSGSGLCGWASIATLSET
jgi:hypothetical protein